VKAVKPKPMLTLESEWRPPLGKPMMIALEKGECPDLGCVAVRGGFQHGKDGYTFSKGGKPATVFVFELIARLQAMATVPMIDVRAYGRWLKD
jgi:hypothetical protein